MAFRKVDKEGETAGSVGMPVQPWRCVAPWCRFLTTFDHKPYARSALADAGPGSTLERIKPVRLSRPETCVRALVFPPQLESFMKLKRLAVLAGCAMWMVCSHATDRLSSPGVARQVDVLAFDAGLGDVRSFVQRIDGPREPMAASSTPPTAMRKAAAAGPLLPAVASTVPEPPSLWLMLLGLFATGIALTRRRFD